MARTKKTAGVAVETAPEPGLKVREEWDPGDESLLRRLYDGQDIVCDQLAYTSNMEVLAESYNQQATEKRTVRSLYLRLQLLRKKGSKGGLKKKVRRVDH